MSTGGPDLFVICKNCQSEVSPYITECPYCGSRLRKRAPKLDREGRRPSASGGRRARRCRGCAAARSRGSAASRAPTRRSRWSSPGSRGRCCGAPRSWEAPTRSNCGRASGRTCGGGCWWRRSRTSIPATRSWRLGAIALYGWLLERRHGSLLVLLLFGISDRRRCRGDRRRLDATARPRRATAARWR